MGVEVREIESITLYNKETGEKIGSFSGVQNVEESSSYTPTTIVKPPEPNIMFVIAEGPTRTLISIYRPKKFNRFQVWMYKFSFGIKIIQGRNEIHEYMSKAFWSPEDRK